MSGRGRTRGPGQAGFTLVEVAVVAALLLVILGAVLTTTQAARSTMQVNEAQASLQETLRTTADRMCRSLRSAALTTIKKKSSGSWVTFETGTSAQSIQFRSADGIPTVNASALTPEREIEFVMDAAETDNDKDDDGDGLVDEGVVTMRIGIPTGVDTGAFPVARGVESCVFELDGRVITMTLQIGRTDRHGNVTRGTLRQSTYIRNN